MNAVTTPISNAVATASAGALLMDMAAMERLERIADLMDSGKCSVPQHLRGSKGDCFAVALQSMQWGMNPFAVAQKTHMTQGGALGYEAQLISAVVTESGAVDGDPEYEFLGDWDKILGKVEERKSDKGGKYYVATYTKADEAGLGVICRLRLKGESVDREMKVMMSQCYPRFSTQWATDPKLQICYVAIRKWSRLHKPGVILGIYTPDELQEPQVVHMGEAVLVEGGPKNTGLPEWPADKWAERMPKLLEGIVNGKSIEDALAWLGSKGKVTAAQEKQLRDEVAKVQKPASTNSDAPQVDPAKLEADMQACPDLDKLYELGGLIDAISDEALSTNLSKVFDARVAELEQP